MPIVDDTLRHHYSDTDEPKLFGNVSALDPEMFCKPDEFADEVIQGSAQRTVLPAEGGSMA